MKKLRNIIVLIIAIVGVTPFIANAAEASINNWSLKCDKTDYIYPGERVKCHIFGQVTNATGTDSNVKYLKSRVTGKAVKIISEGSSTNLTSETHQHLPGESDCPNETNDAGSVLKCYEWYHNILPNYLPCEYHVPCYRSSRCVVVTLKSFDTFHQLNYVARHQLKYQHL